MIQKYDYHFETINSIEFYYYFMKSTVNSEMGVINAVIKIDGNSSVPISTRIKSSKWLWNSKMQCFEGKDSAKKESLKTLFERRMDSIREAIIRENSQKPVNPNDILALHRKDKKEIILASKPKQKIKGSFLEHFKLFINYKTDLVKVGRLDYSTIDILISKRNVVIEFLNERKLIHLKTEEFDVKLMFVFRHWLIMSGKKDSTINKYEQLIKTVTSWSKSTGLSKLKPLEDYTVIKANENEPVYLEEEELEQIYILRNSGALNEYLCRTADIYIFCSETSLSYIDCFELKNSMLSKSNNGTYWIHTNRSKTNTKHRIPLSIKALEIINRYGTLEDLPRISNNKLNIGIRKIAETIGIKKYLTFHTSRKSAVNMMLNAKGMRETTIQAIVGWKDGRQLRRYAKVSDSTIEHEFFNS